MMIFAWFCFLCLIYQIMRPIFSDFMVHYRYHEEQYRKELEQEKLNEHANSSNKENR
jgi:hypothetical protein